MIFPPFHADVGKAEGQQIEGRTLHRGARMQRRSRLNAGKAHRP
jgi:hypothetical protein